MIPAAMAMTFLSAPPELDTDHVGGGVDPEIVIEKDPLHQRRVGRILRRRHHCGWNAARDLFRVAGAGEDGVPGAPEHFGDHLADAQPALHFDPFWRR